MATCPECGCDLPGMDKLCRDCWEARSAGVPNRKWFGTLLVVLISVISLSVWTKFLDGLPRETYQRLDTFSLRAFAIFNGARLTVTIGYAGAIVGTGVMDCFKGLRAGSWRIPLLWMIYVPLLVAILSWKVTGDPAWQGMAIIGAAIPAAYRLSLRFLEWYAS